MKIACLMMQKNERILLEPWILYHGDLFGFENLFIFDNGSTDEIVITVLQKYEKRGVNINRAYNSKSDFEGKGNLIADKIRSLDQCNYYDFFFPLDCDEFIACHDIDGNIKIEAEEIVSSLVPLVNDVRVLAIACAYDNSPVHPNYYLPQPSQRKCFFAKNACLQLDIGFHEGVSKHTKEKLKTNIVYFHFHHKPFDDYIESSKEKLIGRVTGFDRTSLEAYGLSKGPGYHLISRLFLSEQEYNAQFSLKRRIEFVSIFERLLNLGAPIDRLLNVSVMHNTMIQTEKRDSGKYKIHENSLIGNADRLYEREEEIIITGWVLTKKRLATRDIFVPSFGAGMYECKRLPRPDVVRQFPGADLTCGFQIVVAANTLERMTEFPEIYVLDDASDAKIKLTIGSGVLMKWAELKHARNSSDGSRDVVEAARQLPAPQIPSLPSMPKECIELLQSKLADSKVYLEFGSGGSTVLAAGIGVQTIITVESDKHWLASVVAAVSNKKQSKTVPVLVNVGETKEWGFPVSEAGWRQYWSYPLEPWLEIERRKFKPDLILIDGRFRAACFLASLSFAKPGCTILFDDYSHRTYYHFIEKFLKPTRMVGRMAVFVVPKGLVSSLELTAALAMAITDVR